MGGRVIAPCEIEPRKMLSPEAVAAASWRVSPQTVRLWKSKEHARRMMVMYRAIGRSKAKYAKVFAGLERDAFLSRPNLPSLEVAIPDDDELRDWLLTPSQAAAIEMVQRLSGEIRRLGDLINQQNAVYGLGQEKLQLSELSSYLMELDEKLSRSHYAARRLGVNAVEDDFKLELRNGINRNGGKKAA